MSGVIRGQNSVGGNPPISKVLFDNGTLGMNTQIPAIAAEPMGYLDVPNSYFTINRSLKSRPGLTNRMAQFSAQIDGMFDAWLEGNSQITLIISGGVLYQYIASSNTVNIISLVPISGFTASFSNTAGTLVAGTYTYAIAGQNLQGLTTVTEISITTTATGQVVLNWTGQVAATQGYNIYGRVNGGLGLIGTVAAGTTTFTDAGAATPGAVPPTVNTAQFTPGKLFTFAILNNKVMFGNGHDHNYVYDGTTLTDMNAQLVPCAFFIHHQNRLFASPLNSDTVYWCSNENVMDWTTAYDAGFVNVEIGEDQIIGLASWRNNLWIFKGTKYNLVDILVGTSYDNFTLESSNQWIAGFHKTVVSINADTYFLSIDGFYSLAQAAFSYPSIARISDPIQSIVNTIINPENAIGYYSPIERIVLWYVDTGSGYLDTVIVMSLPNALTKTVRWSYWTIPYTTYAALYWDTDVWTSFLGFQNGGVAYLDDTSTQDVTSYTNGVPNYTEYQASIVTQYLNFGDDQKYKRVKKMTLTYEAEQSLLVTIAQFNSASMSISYPGVGISVWDNGPDVWDNGPDVWDIGQAQVAARSLRGMSTAFQVTWTKTSGSFEIFDFQLFIDAGADTMIM